MSNLTASVEIFKIQGFKKITSAQFSRSVKYFHIRKSARDAYEFDQDIFSIRGDVIFTSFTQSRLFADKINQKKHAAWDSSDRVQASQINAMGLVHEIMHFVIESYRTDANPNAFKKLTQSISENDNGTELNKLLDSFVAVFPPPSVYSGEKTSQQFLSESTDAVPNKHHILEEIILLWLSNQNPAYAPIHELIDDSDLKKQTQYTSFITSINSFFEKEPKFGPQNQSLIDLLLEPIRRSPNSITGQLEFMKEKWSIILTGTRFWNRMLMSMDFIKEEGKWFEFKKGGWNVSKDQEVSAPQFSGEYYEHEPEAFSPDTEWMPKVVMIAKSTFVWLDQLSKKYHASINHLSQIPDSELEMLARQGFTGLWLIGLWTRSRASQRIKQINGNPEAVASAYSLHDYEIAPELGGWESYQNLRDRAWKYGIRLASDMVPNHMGIDSTWVVNHPDWFIQSNNPPFPNYSFHGTDLSDDSRVGIFIEDGYWTKSDAAVVFKRVDKWSGETRYIYHGNDGTSMPWNDTAQLNYLIPEVREAVIQTILHVARSFPIIRFDAAMTLAKKHYQRLWFPQPGTGGDIPSRAEHALTKDHFDSVFPVEFWREVVDRVAKEVPNTLLLAEAFWMMEGYFVRTLGMHRVYNSAFMNMLKREDNANYRYLIKNTLEFNPQILKRYVNFMNNPDEETAINQFGKDDKYFGVCMLMSTMPGLPMFGHGQFEGYSEKYGMEFKKAYKNETPDEWLIARHEREISPVLKKRYIFSEVDQFLLYDFYATDGYVNENVFAYSNMSGFECALVVYNNKYESTSGWIKSSVGFLDGYGNMTQRVVGQGLNLHTDKSRFIIFKDHVSGLEFIRSNKDMWEKGLFVEVGGFKYHLFWEFREVISTPEMPYGEIEKFLSGKGAPSIEDALIDLIMKPLHEPFYQAINPGSLKYLSTGFKSGKSNNAVHDEFSKKLADIISGFEYMFGKQKAAKTVAEEIETVYLNALKLPGMDKPKTTKPISPKASKSAKVKVVRSWGDFVRERLDDESTNSTPNWQVMLSWVFAKAISNLLPEERPLTSVYLGKVIEKCFREEGFAEYDVQQATLLLEILTKRETGFLLGSKGIDKPEFVEFLADYNVRSYLQVNFYQDIFWFNKEKMEKLIYWMFVLSLLNLLGNTKTKATPATKIKSIYADVQLLSEAASSSGYQLGKFQEKILGNE